MIIFAWGERKRTVKSASLLVLSFVKSYRQENKF